ncbi:ATP-binding protein [Bradyrhizobium sp. STM 3562]|uniref:ATP-binding protein n=1 Tax=Bradyrhizobium sp. STM 3562 TaxID=578924 RepID=UPI00388F883F
MHSDGIDESALIFDRFRLLPKARLLEKDGLPLPVGGRALDILICLAERAGEVVSKRELVTRVWADVNVDEGSLRFHISALRKVLGDRASGARYVVNVPGRGYCFAAPIARSEAAARVVAPAARPPIPAPIGRMIGRAETIDRLCNELALHRLVTIVGPGGIGKTTVALAVGHRQLTAFAGMVRFVDFGALRDAHLVPSAVATALGLTVSSENPVPSLLAFLREKRLLLIFDSCEHLLESLAALAESIIQEAPEVCILATSRESLRAEGEQVHRLFPLDCPPDGPALRASDVLAYPAAQLFVERIAASLGGFELGDAEAPLVAEICRKLDGIALAIELAAGRVNAYGIQGIATLLNSRFSLLWQGRRTAIPRHQTLSAALSWSYDLLPPAESLTLRRLSVFTGPFTLEAALAVARGDGIGEPEAVEAIANLVAKSLISLPSAAQPIRYRLLDTTRTFAAEKLIESGEAIKASRNHAIYFRDLLASISNGSDGLSPAVSFAPYADHLANIRAALDWSFSDHGDRAIAIALAAAAAPFFLELSLLTECHRWTQQAIAAADAASVTRRDEMVLQAALGASLMFTRGNGEEVRIAFNRSLELAQALEDAHWQLCLLREFHIYLTRIGDFQGALRVGERGEAVAKPLNDPAATRTAEWMLGVAHHLIGTQDKAVVLCESAMLRGPDSRRTNMLRLGYDDRIIALVALARSLWLTGRPDRAVEVARYAVSEAECTEQPLTLGISMIWTIYVFLWVGDWDSADKLIDRLVGHAARHFLGPYQAVGLGLKGELLIRRGEVRPGVELLRQGAGTLRETRHAILSTVFAAALAEGLVQMKQYEEALAAIDAAVAQRELIGQSFDSPEMLRVRGHVLACTAHAAEAESCLLEALTLARKQCAIGWELRTALSLARLWRDQGDAAKAHGLIAPLYARYQEGLDSADLRSAKALLDS